MFAQPLVRSIATLAILAAPFARVAAQGTLGAYAPVSAKYRVTAVQGITQIMMGQTQEFETTTGELISLVLAKSASGLTLTMTLDSASIKSNAPTGVPDANDAIGLKFTGATALDGKIASSEVTDKSGVKSTSQFASTFRSLLPRVRVGAAKGDTWVDSTTALINQGPAVITSETVINYTLAGDTVLAGTKGWKITGVGTTKLNGTGNQQGADYTIKGTAKTTLTAVVSADGVLLGQSSEAEANLTVNVEAASLTIPIVQRSTAKVEKLP